jgi:hypothetical protein
LFCNKPIYFAKKVLREEGLQWGFISSILVVQRLIQIKFIFDDFVLPSKIAVTWVLISRPANCGQIVGSSPPSSNAVERIGSGFKLAPQFRAQPGSSQWHISGDLDVWTSPMIPEWKDNLNLFEWRSFSDLLARGGHRNSNQTNTYSPLKTCLLTYWRVLRCGWHWGCKTGSGVISVTLSGKPLHIEHRISHSPHPDILCLRIQPCKGLSPLSFLLPDTELERRLRERATFGRSKCRYRKL